MDDIEVGRVEERCESCRWCLLGSLPLRLDWNDDLETSGELPESSRKLIRWDEASWVLVRRRMERVAGG